MLRFGVLALTGLCALHIASGLAIFVAVAFLGRHAPAASFLFDGAALAALDPRALATIDGVAILANAALAAFCALVVFLLWTRVRHGDGRALAAVGAALALAQAAGFASDARFGHVNLGVNIGSTALVVAGLAACALARRSR